MTVARGITGTNWAVRAARTVTDRRTEASRTAAVSPLIHCGQKCSSCSTMTLTPKKMKPCVAALSATAVASAKRRSMGHKPSTPTRERKTALRGAPAKSAAQQKESSMMRGVMINAHAMGNVHMCLDGLCLHLTCFGPRPPSHSSAR